MASPSPRRRRGALTAALLATALTGLVPVGISHAEPRPSLQQVQQRIDALNSQIGAINEDFDGARLELAVATRRAGVATARVRAAQAALAQIQLSMSSLAAAAYRSGGADQFVSLMTTSSPQTFLDRASTLDRVAASQSSQLAAAATARHRLIAAQDDAAAQQDAARAVAATMTTAKRKIEQALAEQQQLLGSLRAEERARLAAAQAARLRAAATAARASRSRGLGAYYTGPASGRAGVAVREAYRQLGKPYQWGAAGPDRFDCSGLTMWVWGKAGVSLPHQSRAQFAGGRKVAKSDLQPGDLTFYGDPIHHVGIYVGNGQMISAPQTGDVVKLSNALRDDYVGAIRP